MRWHAPDLLLEEILRGTPRRHRLPAPPSALDGEAAESPATRLALAIERIRVALAHGETPHAQKPVFIDALAALISDAMRRQNGDPVFQAMALRHRAASVRDYATLAAGRKSDVRTLRGHVNAIAHPARLMPLAPGGLRDALAQLHAQAEAAAWAEVADTTQRMLATAGAVPASDVKNRLTALISSPALPRLMRLQHLETDEDVQQYRALLERSGPSAGSSGAARQGAASRRRGADVETSAAQAIEALALRLNPGRPDGPRYRVVTSMRAPSALPGNPDRAKTEWDVVLLRQAPALAGAQDAWDIRLLVEAKASVDAAGTDLPRLLRGLRLLAQAEPGRIYAFQAREGEVKLRGASLSALPTDAATLAPTVFYCCDAPADDSPRLLSAASRMQLLSAPESLAFAAALERAPHADTGLLDPIWRQLLETARWDALLQQLPMLRQARELMLHPADLLARVNTA